MRTLYHLETAAPSFRLLAAVYADFNGKLLYAKFFGDVGQAVVYGQVIFKFENRSSSAIAFQHPLIMIDK